MTETKHRRGVGVRTVELIEAAKKSPQTFNSFYASATEAAFYTSGRLPLRPEMAWASSAAARW